MYRYSSKFDGAGKSVPLIESCHLWERFKEILLYSLLSASGRCGQMLYFFCVCETRRDARGTLLSLEKHFIKKIRLSATLRRAPTLRRVFYWVIFGRDCNLTMITIMFALSKENRISTFLRPRYLRQLKL